MKILVALFAFYTLFLPLLPCADREECPDANIVAVAQIASHNEDHQHESEGCNPFCICNCCPQNYSVNIPAIRGELASSNSIQLKYLPSANSALPADFSAGIWQPPRIS